MALIIIREEKQAVNMIETIIMSGWVEIMIMEEQIMTMKAACFSSLIIIRAISSP